MPPFQFTAPTSPYIGTIADLMGRQSEIQARAAQQVADAQARALYAQGQAGAQMWQGVGQGISQVAQIPLELQRYKSLQQEQQLRGLQLQEAQNTLKRQQDIEATRQQINALSNDAS